MEKMADTSISSAVFVSQGNSTKFWLLHLLLDCLIVGTDEFITSHPGIMSVSLEPSLEPDQHMCRKDIGEMRKLQLWSRGHVFIVRSCGFIDMWKPIYR